MQKLALRAHKMYYNDGMFRTADDVRAVRHHHGMTQRAFAEAVGVSHGTVARWEREGIPHGADQRTVDSFLAIEGKPEPPPDGVSVRDRIAGALADLGDQDLADLLADVKRRQLAALRAEFELGAEADARAAHAAAQAPDGNGKRSRANGG